MLRQLEEQETVITSCRDSAKFDNITTNAWSDKSWLSLWTGWLKTWKLHPTCLTLLLQVMQVCLDATVWVPLLTTSITLWAKWTIFKWLLPKRKTQHAKKLKSSVCLSPPLFISTQTACTVTRPPSKRTPLTCGGTGYLCLWCAAVKPNAPNA